jgi:hypothetical protein
MRSGVRWGATVTEEKSRAAGAYRAWLDEQGRFTTEADRKHAAKFAAVFPEIKPISVANRAFLNRAVAAMAAEVDQFLDLGAGQLNRGDEHEVVRNLHEVAQAVNPAARMVYVDVDPATAMFGSVTLSGTQQVEYLHADARDLDAVLGSAEVARCGLDLSRPIGLIMGAILPFIADQDDPARIVAAYRDASSPGSLLAISHATTAYDPIRIAKVLDVYNQGAPLTFTARSRRSILSLFDGYDLLEPGLVDIIAWRPDGFDPLGGDPSGYHTLVGVGRRR